MLHGVQVASSGIDFSEDVLIEAEAATEACVVLVDLSYVELVAEL